MGNNKWLSSGEIYGVISAPSAPPRGSGKSLVALQLVIEQANMLNYGICTNFDISVTDMYRYAYYMGYFNFCRQIDRNNIFVRSCTNEAGKTNLTDFMVGDRLIFVLDEAGIYASSHNWRDMSDTFKANLALLRKFRARLWWIAQYHTQVANLLRDQTNYIIECSSVLRGSQKLGGASEIWIKIYYVFNKLEYEVLYNKRERLSPLKYSLRRFFGAKIKRFSWFSDEDLLTFQVYNTFGKIGDEPQLLNPKPSSISFYKVNCDEKKLAEFSSKYSMEYICFIYEFKDFVSYVRRILQDLKSRQEAYYKELEILMLSTFGTFDSFLVQYNRKIQKEFFWLIWCSYEYFGEFDYND